MSPRLFPLDDEGYSTLVEPMDVEEADLEHAQLGVLACPERALSLLGKE
jgi:ferredoxin